MRLIDNSTLETLFSEANKSERLRSHYLLHHSHNDKVQRLLIALVKGSYVEPHCHELSTQWEMFLVIEGQIKVTLYNESGTIQRVFLAGTETNTSIVEFSPHEIHSVECLSTRALMLEVKEGPFDPAFAKKFPQW